MADKTLNTIIVLRNDTKEAWEADDSYRLELGEVGVGYMTVAKTVGGETKNVQVPIIKVGDDAKTAWKDLPQAEGVFEKPVTLTQNFGYFTGVPTGGSKTFAETAGMTTSEFLLAALKQTIEPTITQPSASLSASAVIENSDPEIGAKITALKWDGGFSAGSYKIGTATQATGLAADDTTWSVSNSIDSQTSKLMDGTFTLTSDKYIQINTDGSANYARIDADVTLDVNGANTPKNNLGEDTAGKITNASAGGSEETPWKKSANVSVTGYRKPFWGVIAAADGLKAPTEYVSADVRALPNSATTAGGFPTSLAVPAGSQMVVFFAKHGVKTSLTATDDNAMNAGVTFTKVENACSVEGANGFTGTNYDLWYVNWGAGIGSAKQLTLKWS